MLATREIKFAVVGCAGGVDDGVVILLELIEGDVHAHVDVGKQTNFRLVQHLVQGLDDALDAGVIGCHAIANEAEGGRHALVDVHCNVLI